MTAESWGAHMTSENIIEMCRSFISTNWSLILSVVIGCAAYKFIKNSLNLVIGIVFVGFAVSALTNVGVLPPMDELFEFIKEVASVG